MNFLASNIQWLQKQQGISTKVLAKKCGVTEKKLTSLDKDPGSVPVAWVLAFSDIFEVPVGTLLQVDLRLKQKKQKAIQLLVLDIDGVLTDGGMYYAESGNEYKKFNTKDGLAIKRLTRQGMQVAFLSNGINKKLVESRAKLLGVQKVYVGTEEKLTILDSWLKELKLTYKQVAYVGDDINDLAVIKKAGFSACPSDASIPVQEKVHVILSRKGGDACVREFIDLYFS